MLNKLKQILSNKQIYGLIILVFLLLIGTILESFALLSLIPILELILDKNNLQVFKTHIIEYTDLFQNLTYVYFVTLVCVTIVFIYFLKNAYLSLLTFKQNSFLSNLNADLSKKLFENILKKEYLFFTEKNSSEIIKYFQVDLAYFGALCQGFLSLFIEILLSLSVILTVFFLEPNVALISASVIIPFSGLYLLFSKRYLNKIGNERTIIDAKISKSIMEGVNGIKEIKINNLEGYLSNQLFKNENKRAKILTRYNTLTQIPRNIFEFIAILTIIVVIIYKVYANDSNPILSTLGIFVAATFRLLPSVNRIISSIQSISFFKGSFDIIYKLFNDINNSPKEVNFNKINFKSNLELVDLNFSYNNQTQILKNLNLKISKGDFIGFMGESGSGKSTLVNIILGLIQPNSGKIKIDDNQYKTLYKYKNFASYIPQDVFLFDESISKNIVLDENEEFKSNTRLSDVIKKANLEKFISQLPFGLDTKVGERGAKLSGGQIKRLAIARALYSNPELLIFDEATSALDLKTENTFLEEISLLKKTKTIIFISHSRQSLRNCDKIFKLEKGTLQRIK
ncbi:ABC transporter ATP-binding protein/permease [Flavobacteriaceae bacterium]|nr:ABC transporter ATP-binding protein/permease [Flavobacteriaceae bacterium]